MKTLSRHAEWLSLIEISGPFLTVSTLEQAFPQGLDALVTHKRQRLRAAYDEWREAVDEGDALLLELHKEWIRLVLIELLGYDSESLVPATKWPAVLPSVASPEHAEVFAPDWIVRALGDEKPRLFVSVVAPETDLESIQTDDNWPVSLKERMTLLCRAHDTSIGLVTNGERWMLVNAPVGSTSGYASWYARLWFQEPITIQAFQSLLGVRRCFGPTEGRLEALLDESLKNHEEVTDTLGEQVRRAVEVLVQCLDKADEDRNRELLRGVNPTELYEAGLTVMMRLVFVLCAEERGLLLSGDLYDQYYAVSTLRAQLAEEADRHGPEVLDRRHDAWARLLAVFRAVHGGAEHENLRVPAMGGSLFDPDRFPFLEGRAKATRWRDTVAAPLPIDNRTVLLLLNSLQILEQSGGALLLSYRSLDVEQIGHVYEGLLEHTVIRVPRVTLGLVGSQRAKNPNVTLAELESARMDSETTLTRFVAETTERRESTIRNCLTKSTDEVLLGKLIGVCGGDTQLVERIRSFANLLRLDAWQDPIVYRDNSLMVTLGVGRRETGTHYTPKSLTESIVAATLESLVYVGPREGRDREKWTLKSSREILELKVCDPAMGSGAFLVQACRYLGEKLVEAWLSEETSGKSITVDGEAVDDLGASEPMPSHLDERLILARRLVAERCLYGVDVNPLAVELAKLSIWLVTLAKGRPFGFLDHSLRCGDSLLGIHRLEQLTRLNISTTPESGQYQLRLSEREVNVAVNEAIRLRMQLRATTIRDVGDIEVMAKLDCDARIKLESVDLIADAMIGEALRCSGNSRLLNTALDSLAALAGDYLVGNEKMGDQISRQAKDLLAIGLPEDRAPRKPFHWVLEFPEVFARREYGFDCILANPPFVDSETMSKSAPQERAFISQHFSCAKGNWDLFVPFIQRGLMLLGHSGVASILSPNKWLAAPYGAELRAYTKDSLVDIFDFSGSRAFPGVGVAAICSTFSKKVNGPITIWRYASRERDLEPFSVPRNRIKAKEHWGFLLSPYIDILMAISATNVSLGTYVTAGDPFTVSEAYELTEDIAEYTPAAAEFFRFVNTGTIDPYVTLWGLSDVRYLKSRFAMPIIKKTALKKRFPRRYQQASKPKLILSGMRKFEAFLDEQGEYVAGKSSIIVIPKDSRISLLTCLGILNSKLIRFFVQESFGVLGIDGGISFSGSMVENLPLPQNFTGSISVIEDAVRKVLATTSNGGVLSSLMDDVDRVVFDVYGINGIRRKVISESNLRC